MSIPGLRHHLAPPPLDDEDMTGDYDMPAPPRAPEWLKIAGNITIWLGAMMGVGIIAALVLDPWLAVALR